MDCAFTHTLIRTQTRAHSDRHRLEHTHTHTTQMCTHTNTHLNRCSHRHRYARADTRSHAGMLHTGTQRHTQRPARTLAHAGSTLSQASSSGGGAAHPRQLPPSSSWSYQASRGRPRPLPSRPSCCGRGSMWSPPSLPPKPGPLCSPALEEATVPGDRLATESLRPCLVSLISALEMSWGALGHSAGMAATTRRGEPAGCSGRVQGQAGGTIQPPGTSQACIPSFLPTVCPRVC